MRKGFRTPETWEKYNESAIVFVQHAIMRGIGEERWNLLQRNVEYHLEVSDVAEREGLDTALENRQLVVTRVQRLRLSQDRTGDRRARGRSGGIGSGGLLDVDLCALSVMRLYNHDDALQYEERMTSWPRLRMRTRAKTAEELDEAA